MIDINNAYRTTKTPSLIINIDDLKSDLVSMKNITANTQVSTLYTLKPMHNTAALKIISDMLDGFSVSSLNEAKLAHQISSDKITTHYVSPHINRSEIDEILAICDYISFNSTYHFHHYIEQVHNNAHVGIRINPKASFVVDDRYNPTRQHSKLGVEFKQFLELAAKDRENRISGVHIHNNCNSYDLNHLKMTIEKVLSNIGNIIKGLKWINIGGGYLFNEIEDLTPFYDTVNHLSNDFGLTVFIEPGSAIVKRSTVLISTVIDIIPSDNKFVAILDTTVNHMPEVFEYQYEPDISGHVENAAHSYILAGCSCLAGDVFGEYSFEEPLEIGSKVIFENMGAYTLVKANMFNGINLPTIYTYSEDAGLKLIKEYTYDDFLMLSGDNSNVSS